MSTQCAPRYRSIEWLAPAEGAFVQSGVGVRMHLAENPGRLRRDPPSLELTVRGSSALLDLADGGSGIYQGVLPALTDGPATLVASWNDAALVSPELHVIVDGRAPQFAVSVPDPQRVNSATTQYSDQEPGWDLAWKRNETVEVQVRADETLALDGMNLSISHMDGGAPIAVPVMTSTNCDAGYCGVAQVKLWTPEMGAFREQFALRVSGADLAGNLGSGQGAVKVTRFKWAYNSGAQQIHGTPAIASSGNIFLGTSATPTIGQVIALSGEGSELWKLTSRGAVDFSPAIGSPRGGGIEPIFVSTTGSLASLLVLSSIDGGSLAAPCSTSGATAGSAVAIAQLGTINETALTVFNGSAGGIAALGTNGSCAIYDGGVGAPIPVTTETNASVAIKGSTLYFPSATQVASYPVNSGQSRSGFPVELGQTVYALVLSGSEVVGGGGGLSFSTGGLYAFAQTNPVAPILRYPAAATTRVRSFVVNGNSEAVIARESGASTGKLSRVQISNGALAADVDAPSIVRSVPVLGQGGRLYTASTTGVVNEWAASSLQPIWSLTGVGPVEGGLTLDCPRDGSGAILVEGPGVLYVPSTSGILYSIIVDSRGLDTTAVWPKAQRDPRNSGNADLNLQAFSCDP